MEEAQPCVQCGYRWKLHLLSTGNREKDIKLRHTLILSVCTRLLLHIDYFHSPHSECLTELSMYRYAGRCVKLITTSHTYASIYLHFDICHFQTASTSHHLLSLTYSVRIRNKIAREKLSPVIFT